MKDYFRTQALGANKRTRTRGILLDSAIGVFSEKGIEEANINEITAIAGLANGTFYNHFKDKDELAAATAAAITFEIAKQLDLEMSDLKRGVSRVVLASWAFLLVANSAGSWAQVLVGHYHRKHSVKSQAFTYMKSDLDICVRQKEIKVTIDEFLMEQIAALMMSALSRMLIDENVDNLPQRTCEHILRLLGLPPAQAKQEVAQVAKHQLLSNSAFAITKPY